MDRFLLLALCISISIPGVAAAHDMIQPEWRDQEGTTYQEWRFDTGVNPAVPEVIHNQYGGASASITVGTMGEGWQYQLPGLGSQTGYWDLGDGGGQIVLGIDNRPLPLDYKEIWVQVTYYQDISQPPTVDVPGATCIGGQTGLLVEDTGNGSGWFLDQSVWLIEPNPDYELVVLTSDVTWGSVIDQIVVDTICIPEPTTVGLLALAGLMLLQKRHHKKHL
jgi:hypothetical protein